MLKYKKMLVNVISLFPVWLYNFTWGKDLLDSHLSVPNAVFTMISTDCGLYLVFYYLIDILLDLV